MCKKLYLKITIQKEKPLLLFQTSGLPRRNEAVYNVYMESPAASSCSSLSTSTAKKVQHEAEEETDTSSVSVEILGRRLIDLYSIVY